MFKELTNKQLTDAKKKEIPVKLNKKSIIKGRLSQDYIDGFILPYAIAEKMRWTDRIEIKERHRGTFTTMPLFYLASCG